MRYIKSKKQVQSLYRFTHTQTIQLWHTRIIIVYERKNIVYKQSKIKLNLKNLSCVTKVFSFYFQKQLAFINFVVLNKYVLREVMKLKSNLEIVFYSIMQCVNIKQEPTELSKPRRENYPIIILFQNRTFSLSKYWAFKVLRCLFSNNNFSF